MSPIVLILNGFGVALLGLIGTLAGVYLKHRLQEIHVLVNSRLSEALEKVNTLTTALEQAKHENHKEVT